MYIVLYQFHVRPGEEATFEHNWHPVIQAFYEHRGSLGSRLHKGEDGTYLAYAQWPDVETHDRMLAEPLPPEAMAARARMQAACSSIKAIHKMVVVDDLLASTPAKKSG